MSNCKLLSVKDIQDILGISRKTAYDLVKNGEIESIRIGKLYKISEKSLDKFMSKKSSTTQKIID